VHALQDRAGAHLPMPSTRREDEQLLDRGVLDRLGDGIL
jgi:hypothetical protein